MAGWLFLRGKHMKHILSLYKVSSTDHLKNASYFSSHRIRTCLLDMCREIFKGNCEDHLPHFTRCVLHFNSLTTVWENMTSILSTPFWWLVFNRKGMKIAWLMMTCRHLIRTKKCFKSWLPSKPINLGGQENSSQGQTASLFGKTPYRALWIIYC